MLFKLRVERRGMELSQCAMLLSTDQPPAQGGTLPGLGKPAKKGARQSRPGMPGKDTAMAMVYRVKYPRVNNDHSTQSAAVVSADWHENGSRSAILLIVDEPPVRDFLTEAMERRGIPVWAAANVAEALDMLHDHGPGIGVVVVEHNLPE